jgi:plastocyanin
MNPRAPLTAGLAAAALALAACGGDDESDSGGESASETQPSTLTVTAAEQGKETQLSAPASVEAGAVTVELENTGKRRHSIQLARYDEGHQAEELLQAGNAWASGKKPLPEWVHLSGGTGSVKGGETGSVTVALEPGSYVALDTNAPGQPPFAEFEVTGEGGDAQVPDAAATIEAEEYSFTTAGLEAGASTVRFDNAGEQPHHVEAVGLREGATIEDVERFFKTEKGKPPIDESKSFAMAILDGGESQTAELDIPAGRYAVLCFIPDREGGPPHAARGMINEVEVK